ncbi:MAG: dihydroorotate dehydrogenase electron transfer subunit [Candidatus Odinarchaeota archaeon]
MNSKDCFDLPWTLPVIKKRSEGEMTVTLSFTLPGSKNVVAKPGQYFMLWMPGDDEIPVSVSRMDGHTIEFTICNVGSTTKNMVSLDQSSLVGLRGPFGNGFDINHHKNVLLIAGGMGIPPLRYLIYHILENFTGERNIFLIQGAKTKDELYFREEFEKLPVKMEPCTDDGSFGFHGFPSKILADFLEDQAQKGKESDWEIYTCGPEKMLKAILMITKDYKLEKSTQISLADRYIRCGFGICGSCFLDDLGLSICKDGPVFRGDVLLKIKDFGHYGRAADGSKYTL